VRFPKTIRHRKAECKIYGKARHYASYRVAWRAGGQRHMKNFRTYSDAKKSADECGIDRGHIRRSGLAPPAVSVTLLGLEMKRLTRGLPGKIFVKTTRPCRSVVNHLFSTPYASKNSHLRNI
jgi:hypothetical protein